MRDDLITRKSYEFALEVIGVYKFLIEHKKEFVLSKQLLKSGTSIGANVEEAESAQSRRDFLAREYDTFSKGKICLTTASTYIGNSAGSPWRQVSLGVGLQE